MTRLSQLSSTEGSLNPPFSNSVKHCSPVYTKSASPFGDVESFPIEGDVVVGSEIGRLFYPCSPIAILGRVSKVVVPSFNRVLMAWSSPHVGKEILKRVQPTVTDFNSSTPVVMVVSIFLSVASSFHLTPRIILAVSVPFSCHTMLSPFAPTVCGVLSTQGSHRYVSYGPTGAPARDEFVVVSTAPGLVEGPSESYPIGEYLSFHNVCEKQSWHSGVSISHSKMSVEIS